MSRAWSITVLFLMLVLLPFSAAAPLLAAWTNAGSDLPACCRRGGAHGCAMQHDHHGQSAGPSIRALVKPCAAYPPTAPLPSSPIPMVLPPLTVIRAALYSHPASPAQTAARYRVSQYRSHQKRGPPVSFNS